MLATDNKTKPVEFKKTVLGWELTRLFDQWVNRTVSQPITLTAARLFIQQLIALIDGHLSELVNHILHHSKFQQLEASWRGLHYLVQQATEHRQIIIRFLDVSWAMVTRDLEYALDFDQSQIFNKIYSQEFGHPGGRPFGLLIGDYYLQHQPRDLVTLRGLAKVAAAAFAPFITSVAAAFFELEDYTQLNTPLNLTALFQQPRFKSWRLLREDEDARFIGLVLPRILLRLPYQQTATRIDQFCFREQLAAKKHYLWGNASFGFAAVVIRAFNETGWLADIRGVQNDLLSGGVITDLNRHYFETDNNAHAQKIVTEINMTESLEKQLSNFGFISLMECQYTDLAAFYNCQSIQQAKQYNNSKVQSNANLSTMLHYLLCVSRFAHYLKIIFRNKIGSFITPEACEQSLQQWITNYVAASEDLPEDLQAKYPLREAQVKVIAKPDQPGCYIGIFHLKPHYQIERLETSLRLVTELTSQALK